MAATQHNPNGDLECQAPLTDGVSCMAWSPKGNWLSVGTWANQVIIWEAQPAQTPQGVQAVPKAMMTHEAPVLTVAWSPDASRIFSGGCDKKAKMSNLQTSQEQVIGTHDAPIRQMFWIEENNVLVTGSWDKTIKYWDLRQVNPVATVQLPDKVFCMDVQKSLMVVGTAERHILIYDCLRAPTTEFRRIASPLKFQSRCIACFPDCTGFALGSIEGRVAIHHIQDKDQPKNFAFKCHRDNLEIFSVNSIAFHPTYGTFATAGSDGAYNFWDKDSKQRLKPFNRSYLPITCSKFNAEGSLYAYALSYDWSKGHEFANNYPNNYVMIHPASETDIKPRPQVTRNKKGR